MAPVTTSIQVGREQAAVMLGSVRAMEILQREFPSLYAVNDPGKLASSRIILEAALERIGWLENRQWDTGLRERLAAHTSYPKDAA